MAERNEQTTQGPLRFIVFLVLLALLFAYAADRWDRHHEATFGDRDLGLLAVWDRSEEDEEGPGGPANGEPQLVPELDAGAPDEAGTLDDGGSLPDPLSEGIDFAGQRLERDRVRSRQLDMLTALSRDTEADSETRDAARGEMIRLHEAMTVENELEHLLRLRGFADAFVLRHRQGVVVVVAAATLDVGEVRAVAGLAGRVAGVDREAIGIMTYDPAD